MPADGVEPLLEIRGLRTQFATDDGVVRAVDGVDLRINPGQTLCVVGESGCGKSVTGRSIMQLVDPPGRITEGEILFRPASPAEALTTPAESEATGLVARLAGGGRRERRRRRRADPQQELREAAVGEALDLAALEPNGTVMRRIRGNEIGMIFQEPMVALSPVHTIGQQLVETLMLHEPDLTKAEARERAIGELKSVGIPQPEKRIDAYSFQLSGGMRQRAMIAMAIACRPQLLIADEPTTALDVTTQAQILQLLAGLQAERGMAILFITHDLGVVAEIADRVAVMYLGTVVEECDVDTLFHDPRHPYTAALLRSVPRIEPRARRRLPTIRGQVPHPQQRPSGCPYRTRCDQVVPGHCETVDPPLVVAPDNERQARCLHYPTPASVHTGEDLLPIIEEAGHGR